MKRLCAAVLPLILLATSPALLVAKGPTVKITIEPEPTGPLEITDSKVRQFSVWSGPGTSVNGIEAKQGFIIDWGEPVDAPPRYLLRYEVSFYTSCAGDSCPATDPALTYVVLYCHNASEEGFVYLPREGDEFAKLNMASMFRGRGLEGHWFRSTRAWDEFITPVLLKAARKNVNDLRVK